MSTGMKVTNYGSHQSRDSFCQPMNSWYCTKTESTYSQLAHNQNELSKIGKVWEESFIHWAQRTISRLRIQTICFMLVNTMMIDNFASNSSMTTQTRTLSSLTSTKWKLKSQPWESCWLFRVSTHAKSRVTLSSS